MNSIDRFVLMQKVVEAKNYIPGGSRFKDLETAKLAFLVLDLVKTLEDADNELYLLRRKYEDTLWRVRGGETAETAPQDQDTVHMVDYDGHLLHVDDPVYVKTAHVSIEYDGQEPSVDDLLRRMDAKTEQMKHNGELFDYTFVRDIFQSQVFGKKRIVFLTRQWAKWGRWYCGGRILTRKDYILPADIPHGGHNDF